MVDQDADDNNSSNNNNKMARSTRSDDRSSRSPSGSPGPANRKTRLTEAEKRANHLASEKKRRALIRAGFDRLSVIVPGLEGRARSEGIVLRGTIDHIRKLMIERRRMVETLEANGMAVDAELKAPLELLPHWFFDDNWEDYLMGGDPSLFEGSGSPAVDSPAVGSSAGGNGAPPKMKLEPGSST